jgi:MYXO-CTERM domain-containing protein
MSLLAKIVTFVIYAAVTGLVSGAIGNAMGNPGDAGGAWLAFMLAGLIALAAVRKRSGALGA